MTRAGLARNVSVLAACQALFFMCNTILVSTAPLVGLQLAPDQLLATLPIGAQFIGTMACTMPASRLMKRIGRRDGLTLGTALGVVAGLASALAVWQGSFVLFCLAGIIYGGFSAFGQYYRFAAADAADAADLASAGTRAAARGRAIAWVMGGGLIAAVLGPEIAKATSGLLAPILFAGCYLAIAALALAAGVTLRLLTLGPPAPAARLEAGRPLRQIVRQPAAITAFLAALVAYVTMNLLMTATPLAMLACGHDFADSALVIQWHVVGMFAPSFVTGALIGRLGVGRVIGLGVALNLACVTLAFSGVAVASFAAALFLLGVGWNLMFVGATTLLTTCYRQAEKAKVQGLNDLLLFGTVATSAVLSGLLHALVGWQAMNLLVVPALLAVGLLLLARQRAGRSVVAAG